MAILLSGRLSGNSDIQSGLSSLGVLSTQFISALSEKHGLMDEDMKVFITSTDEDEDDDREEAFTVEQSQMIIKMATEQIDAGSNIVIESLTRYVEI
jgi:hypothetical protein